MTVRVRLRALFELSFLAALVWSVKPVTGCSSIIGSACIPSKDEIRDGLTAIPDFVDKVILSKSNLVTLPTERLCSLPKLKVLEVPDNGLTSVPDLSECLRLEVLILSNNRIESLNATALTHLVNLTTLKLDRNKISGVLLRKHLPSLPKLKVLDLSRNKVSGLEDGVFTGLETVEEINLHKNKIRALPRTLFNGSGPAGRSLKRLDLGQNRLTELDYNQFFSAPHLKHLDLSFNRIRSVSHAAIKLDWLTKLSLAGNRLSTFTVDFFFELKALQSLDVSANGFSAISDSHIRWQQAMPSVQFLNFSHNALSAIDRSTFSDPQSTWNSPVRTLLLQHNQISTVGDDTLLSLPHLSKLDVSSNQLTGESLAKLLAAPLRRLRRLLASDNRIRSVLASTFSEVSRLKVINVDGNPVATVADGAFTGLVDLQKLEMDTDTLDCNCKLSWMPGWARDNGFEASLLSSISCGSPEPLAGKPMSDLQLSDFVCKNKITAKPTLPEEGVVIQEPDTGVPLLNASVVLTCEAATTSNASVTVSWTRNGHPVTEQSVTGLSAVAVSTNKTEKSLEDADLAESGGANNGSASTYYLWTSSLSLDRLSQAESGMYRCTFSNDFGQTSSGERHVFPHVAPTFVQRPVDMQVHIGQNAKFGCSAVAVPTPTVTWVKKDSEDFPAAKEGRLTVAEPGAEDILDKPVIIEDVQVVDEGVYSCVAENVAGAIFQNVNLTVLRTPVVERVACEALQTPARTYGRVHCQVLGSPQPTVSWYRGDTLLSTSEEAMGANTTSSSASAKYTTKVVSRDRMRVHTLAIADLTSGDVGEYRCAAANSLGRVHDSCRLDMTVFTNPVGIGGPLAGVNHTLQPGGGPAASGPPGGSEPNKEPSISTEVIVVAVVCCAVGTSVVWVIIIYQTRRKKKNENVSSNTEETFLRATNANHLPRTGSSSSSPPPIDDRYYSLGGGPLRVPQRFQEAPKVFGEPGNYRTAAIFPSDTGFEEDSQSTLLGDGAGRGRSAPPGTAHSLDNMSDYYGVPLGSCPTSHSYMDGVVQFSTFQPKKPAPVVPRSDGARMPANKATRSTDAYVGSPAERNATYQQRGPPPRVAERTTSYASSPSGCSSSAVSPNSMSHEGARLLSPHGDSAREEAASSSGGVACSLEAPSRADDQVDDAYNEEFTSSSDPDGSPSELKSGDSPLGSHSDYSEDEEDERRAHLLNEKSRLMTDAPAQSVLGVGPQPDGSRASQC